MSIYARAAVAALLTFALCGCGKLTKVEAETKIKKAYFDSDDSLQCEWGDLIQAESPADKTYKTIGNPTGGWECMRALASVKAITTVVDSSFFSIGEKGSVDHNRLKFACGKRVFKEVSSIATEEKNATVKYSRVAQLDKQLLGAVNGCQLRENPKEGELERTATFKKDDDGNWNLSE